MATTEVCLTKVRGTEVSIVAWVCGVEAAHRLGVAAVDGAEVSIFTGQSCVNTGLRCICGIAVVDRTGVAVIAEQEREGAVSKNIVADIGSAGVAVVALLLNVQACPSLVHT